MKLRQPRKCQKPNHKTPLQQKKTPMIRKSKVIAQPKKKAGSQLTPTFSNARKTLEDVVSHVKALRNSNFKKSVRHNP